MKRNIYIFAFVVLGILLQFLVHAGLEIWYIGLLIPDFDTYSLGFSWEQWIMIHTIGTVILLIVGVLLGLWQGKYWWKRIYER